MQHLNYHMKSYKIIVVVVLDLDLECLASWKDGSETYFYSRLNGPGITAKDDRYRCFVCHMVLL